MLGMETRTTWESFTLKLMRINFEPTYPFRRSLSEIAQVSPGIRQGCETDFLRNIRVSICYLQAGKRHTTHGRLTKIPCPCSARVRNSQDISRNGQSHTSRIQNWGGEEIRLDQAHFDRIDARLLTHFPQLPQLRDSHVGLIPDLSGDFW